MFTRGDRRGDRRRDYRRDQLHAVNTRGDCRAIIAATSRGDNRHDNRCDDRRSRTGDRSSNPFADRRRYANYINQKLTFWGLDGHNNVRFIVYGSSGWIGIKRKRKITRSQEL